MSLTWLVGPTRCRTAAWTDLFARQGSCLYNRITGLLSELSTLPSIPVFASIIQNPPMFCLDAERGSQSSLLHHILGRVNVLADSSAIALFLHGFPTFTKRPYTNALPASA